MNCSKYLIGQKIVCEVEMSLVRVPTKALMRVDPRLLQMKADLDTTIQ